MRRAILVVMLAAAPLAAQEQTKVITVKHRPAESLARLLAGVRANASRDFNTITLIGQAEAVKVAEAVIAQYDTPRRQAEFIIRAIEASSSPQGPNDAADLVPAELKSLLRYTRYAHRDSAILRGMESDYHQIALASNLGGRLMFRVREGQPPVIELQDFRITGPKYTIKGKDGADVTVSPELLQTTTTLKDGETVVLGASKMIGGSSGLIVLLTAKLLP